MKHVKLLIIKWIATFTILFLVLRIGYGFGYWTIFTISLLSLFTYFIGDIYIFKRVSNLFATLLDFVVYFVVILTVLNIVSYGGDALTAALFSAALIAIYEVFFHIYVREHADYHRQSTIDLERYDYMTEISDEINFDFDDEDEFF